MDNKRLIILGFMFFIFLAVWNSLAGIVDATNSPILQRFNTISAVALALPSNGNAAPRIAWIKHSAGNLIEGHILVSNFDKNANLQAAGSAIVDVAPDGSFRVFSRVSQDEVPGLCPGGAGAITGLVVLRDGWVIAGVMPHAGTEATQQGGCLMVIDSTGKPVQTFSGSLINGPRDLIAYEGDYEAKLFLTNALDRRAGPDGAIVNERSTVRINLSIPPGSFPRISSMTVIASGFPEIAEPDTLVSGPLRLGLSPRCGDSDDDNCPADRERREQLLYIVDSSRNRIAVIENALTRTTSAGAGTTLSAGGSLNDPRGLVIAPNGHILTVNHADGVITELTPQGQQIARAAGGQYWFASWDRHILKDRIYSEFAALQ